MLHNWFLLTLIAGISSNLFGTLNRHLLHNGGDSTAYGWWFETFRFIIFSILALFNFSLILSFPNIALLFSLGISEVVGIFLFMKMHAHTELSLSSVVMQLRVIWVPLFAFMYLSEHLTVFQYLGVFAVFVGCLLVMWRGQTNFNKNIRYALLFSLVSAISSLLQKQATLIASTPVIIAAFSAPSVFMIPILMKNPWARLKHTGRALSGQVLSVTIINMVLMLSLVEAYRLSTASQVAAIFQGVSMLTVVVGIFFLQEKDHKWVKLAAAAITMVGIILLI